MTASTPGPWRFLESDDHAEPHNACRPLTIAGPNNDDLANVYSSDDATVSIPREQAVANARLMAAAPELLAALQAVELARNSDEPNDWQRATDLSDAAIAKVKGKAS